jgi:hypothetical protein
LAKAKHFTNFSLGESVLSSKVPNLIDLLVSQFGLGVIYTLFVRVIAMFYSIKGIFTASSPSQVPKGAVGSYAVPVPTLHSRRARSDKGQQDEPMHPYGRMSFFAKQSYNGITKAHGWFKHFLGCANYEQATLTSLSIRAHRALIANVVPGKSRNWLENLIKWGKMGITHGAGLLVRLAVWGEPVLLLKQRPARSFIARVN